MRQTIIHLKNKTKNYYCLNLHNIQNQQSNTNTNLNFQGRERERELQNHFKRHFCVKYKCKLWQEHARGGNTIHFVSRCLANKKHIKNNTYQGDLVSAWNAFLLNVFNSIGYLRWWRELFHAKEPEKEKLVLKISILVLGKSCVFLWT